MHQSPVLSSDLSPRLLRVVEERFSSPDYEPPKLPAVAMELMRMSQDANVSREALVGVLERDALLAARVLKRARSAAYGGRHPVTDLSQAVARLGLRQLSDLVLLESMRGEIFRTPGYDEPMVALADHGQVTAIVSRIVCKVCNIPGDFAYMCGLLHDVGMLAGLLVVSHRRRRPLPIEEVWPVIHAVHEEAGATIAEAWKLPPHIKQVIRLHHRVVDQGFPHAMAAAVLVAENTAIELGFGHGGPEGDVDPAAWSAAVELLELDRTKLGQVRAESVVAVDGLDLAPD